VQICTIIVHHFLLVVKVFFVSLLKQRKNNTLNTASKGRYNDNNKPARSDHERHSSSTAKYRIHHRKTPHQW
jgi:hypothetical protein